MITNFNVQLGQVMTETQSEAIRFARQGGATIAVTPSITGNHQSIVAVEQGVGVSHLWALRTTNCESVARGAIRSYWFEYVSTVRR